MVNNLTYPLNAQNFLEDENHLVFKTVEYIDGQCNLMG